jgi:MFS family permease
MLVVALPAIADDLNVSLATASWVIVIPMIASSSLQSIAGRLGDLFGYRRALAVGLVGFAVVTVAAAFAPTFWALVVLRALQTTFGSASFPNCSALIRVNLPEARRASAFGAVGAAISFAITGGPFVGGILEGVFGWRAIFIANLPFTIAALALLITRVPPDPADLRGRTRSIDIVGSILLMATIISIILPLTFVRDGYLSLAALPIAYAGALAILGLLVFWELRQAEPIVQVRLYLAKNFRLAVFSEMFMNFAGFPLTVVLSIFLQEVQDRSAFETGIVIAGGSVAMALMSPVGGRLADRFGRRRPIIAGRAIMVGGLLFMLLTLSAGMSAWLVTIGMALVFAGNGLALPPGQAAAIESAPRRFSGMAAGVASTTTFMGGILGITWSSIYLGEDPAVGKFTVVYLAFLIAAVIAIVVAWRLADWPAMETVDD